MGLGAVSSHHKCTVHLCALEKPSGGYSGYRPHCNQESTLKLSYRKKKKKKNNLEIHKNVLI